MTIGRRVATVIAIGAAALSLAAPASAQPYADHADTQKLLDGYLTHAGPGAAVFAGNRTSGWELHSGVGNAVSLQPIASDQHFRIASQTKTFTASVLLQLVDEGKVVLDAPIERYLPGVVDGNGYDGNKISVRQILQHLSGIPAKPSPTAKPGPDGTYDLRELVRDGLRTPPKSAPGTTFEYSNTNFLVAGLLIEQVTGMPVGDAITQRIIQPLGLTHTVFPRPGNRSLPAPYLPGYLGGRLGPLFWWTDITTSIEPSQWSSAGAIVSTQQDMAAFDQALADGKVMSPTSLAQMRTTVPWPALGVDYGLGLMHRTLSCGVDSWGHAGDLPGYSSVTMATADGRHASVVSNSQVTNALSPNRFDIIDSALCGTPAG